MTDVDRHAQRLIAVAFDIFQCPLAHRHAQATALGGFGTGIGGAQFFGMGQRCVHQVFKKGAAVTEAALGTRVRFVHSGSYDTWPYA